MFPVGLPGLGLALLRLAVVLASAAALCSPGRHVPHVAQILIGLTDLGLLLGAWTPVFAAVVVAVNILTWAISPQDALLRAVALLITVALLLLGPGAYSLDAQRFNRIRIAFPDEDP
jgi:uncharacterized membrane protein YphA (DoxX/SURF4 family)